MPKLCESCKQTESVITLRHRKFCKPCASKFILQKFKRQMGITTQFFETLKKESKGRLNRILVIADSSSASIALVNMLESYYTRDDGQEKYMESQRRYINILDTANPAESQVSQWTSPGMEVTRIALDDAATNRMNLSFDKGRILRTVVEDSSVKSPEDVLTSFAADSRGEARSILWSKIVSLYAHEGNYDVVLYYDTATQIASKVLALTSQGRGFTLPWECGSLVKMPNGINASDTLLMSGVYSARPLKDLSDTEITAYLDILHDRPFSSNIDNTRALPDNSPATSIDEMMINYISGLEASFPSIVATTGRTADKLDFPTVEGDDSICLTCNMPKRSDNVKTWLENITVTEAAPEEGSEKLTNGNEADDDREDVTGEICYGCYTLFRSSRGIVEWPQ